MGAVGTAVDGVQVEHFSCDLVTVDGGSNNEHMKELYSWCSCENVWMLQ